VFSAYVVIVELLIDQYYIMPMIQRLILEQLLQVNEYP
jgi:hypothetical protein